jgi:hypothetical protein
MLPARYPDEVPEIAVQKVAGVSQAALEEHIKARAAELIGNEMVS